MTARTFTLATFAAVTFVGSALADGYAPLGYAKDITPGTIAAYRADVEAAEPLSTRTGLSVTADGRRLTVRY